MPKAKYDRFFLDEFVKKYPNQAKIEGIFEEVKTFEDDDFLAEFEVLLNINTKTVQQ